MSIVKLSYHARKHGKAEYSALKRVEFESFNTSLLGIGDISKEGHYEEALAAVFDLKNFTGFCNQIDPHLVIPDYLNTFLAWLLTEIKKEFTYKESRNAILLWSELPFFAKFMGDGVLFLWDTKKLDPVSIGNIIISLNIICSKYTDNLLPVLKRSFVNAPSLLRCGIARGQIISIGDGSDFVGASINIASRIQKLNQFSFAFAKRGFDREKCFPSDNKDTFSLIKSSIRGIGEEELIFVRKSELKLLSLQEQSKLKP